MKSAHSVRAGVAGAVLTVLALASDLPAQPGGPKGPVVVSPVVGADRKVTFRIHAPKAEKVGMFTSDIPGGFEPRPMKKGDNGVWELTLGKVEPGTYRYLFNVDGVLTADTRNQAVSESNGNA